MKLRIAGSLLIFLSFGWGNKVLCCGGMASGDFSRSPKKEVGKNTMDRKAEFRLATFGSGCFWCTEAIFERLDGVGKAVSGYSGGHVENPTYEQVCTGTTGHAESIQITYDPSKVSYDALLEVFWKTHDPTTKNRQGNDIGPQYRSVIFYHDAEQKKLAESYRSKLDAERIWNRPIVTEIVPFSSFWPAEDYHQNYYDNNPEKSYCSVVITPKIEKFRKIFKDRLKNR
jgi:peptide-methionine (S)-S-oxide reductase